MSERAIYKLIGGKQYTIAKKNKPLADGTMMIQEVLLDRLDSNFEIHRKYIDFIDKLRDKKNG